jgi:hypothetical protein
MHRIIVLFSAVSLLAACATPTPYQAAEGSRRGYTENQIENNRFRVSFGGNSITERETVETYLLYRAAELTIEHGYDHFFLVQRATDESTRHIPVGPDPFLHPASRFHYTYFHPRWGWRSWRDPFWDDVSYREISRFEASAEIIFGHGPKPQDPDAFDARQVLHNLGNQIVRPTAE